MKKEFYSFRGSCIPIAGRKALVNAGLIKDTNGLTYQEFKAIEHMITRSTGYSGLIRFKNFGEQSLLTLLIWIIKEETA